MTLTASDELGSILREVSDEQPKGKKRSKEFDYGTVSDNLAPQMRETAERIQHYKRKQLIDAIDIGRDLLGIQRKLDYGRFLEWIAVECQWSTRTAERYQRLAEVFGPRIDRLSNLGLERAHLLAQPSTPEVVVTQMLERTNAGDRPSTPEIRKLIKTEQKRLQEKNKQKEKGIESDETADAPAEIDEPVTAASPAAGRGEGSNAISPPQTTPCKMVRPTPAVRTRIVLLASGSAQLHRKKLEWSRRSPASWLTKQQYPQAIRPSPAAWAMIVRLVSRFARAERWTEPLRGPRPPVSRLAID